MGRLPVTTWEWRIDDGYDWQSTLPHRIDGRITVRSKIFNRLITEQTTPVLIPQRGHRRFRLHLLIEITTETKIRNGPFPSFTFGLQRYTAVTRHTLRMALRTRIM